MDKQILQYLDKVGEKIGGVAKEGFDVYIHGVFIQSLIGTIVCSISTIIVIFSVIQAFLKIQKGIKNQENNFYWDTSLGGDVRITILIPFLELILLIAIIFSLYNNLIGLFAPDYVAIKNIVEGVR